MTLFEGEREFPEGTRTAQDAAAAIGCEVGQIVKSLVFLRDGEPVLVLCSGANTVDAERLGLAKADADVVRRATGFAIGGVPPSARGAQRRDRRERQSSQLTTSSSGARSGVGCSWRRGPRCRRPISRTSSGTASAARPSGVRSTAGVRQ